MNRRARHAGPLPIVIAPSAIRRLLERNATILLLPRDPRRGVREVHDKRTLERNAGYRKMGRPDLQEDPHRFSVEVGAVTMIAPRLIDLVAARAAGYKTTEELREDWLERHPRLGLDHVAAACVVRIVEETRLLRVGSGYTSIAALAVDDAGEGVDERTLERFAAEGAQGTELRRIVHSESLPISERLRLLEQRAQNGDREAQRHLFMIRKHLRAADRRRARAA